MNTLEFLQAVWPPKGLYAIARPFQNKEGKVVYPSDLFATIEDAAEHVALTCAKRDTFFNVHTLIERRKEGPRKQDNMRACRVFFFDLDCGPKKDYPSQRDAVAALNDFVTRAKLPKPMMVSSGRGVHVYFRMDEAIPSRDWRTPASKLKRLADHFGLKYDPSRTTDTSSLLRPAGSLHLKDPENPRRVEVKFEGVVTPTADLLALIDTAFAEADLSLGARDAAPADVLGSNTDRVFDGPPVPVEALGAACAQMARILFNRGDVSQPEWYWGMGVLRHVENGEQLCHDLLDGHPDYDAAQTDAKLAQLEEYGPTSCAKMEEICGPTNCLRCPFHSKVKSPMVAARRVMARQPIETVQQAPAPASGEPETPRPAIAPPWPFELLKTGVFMTEKTEKGEPDSKHILPYVLFPRFAASKTEIENASSEWVVERPLPGGGKEPHVFTLSIAQLNESRDLGKVLLNEGVFLDHGTLNHVRRYMSAYLRSLQKHQTLHHQYDHLGWTNEGKSFVIGETVLHSDGKKTAAILTPIAGAAKTYMLRKGCRDRQVAALRFYCEPQYRPHQFMVLCSFASALYAATGLHGTIVNISGDSGASKSSALFAAAGVWGSPQHYVVNGTPDGSTRNARNDRIMTLSNLPMCLDEITMMTPEEARMFAFNISQPGGRGRLRADGTLIKTRAPDKAMIALTSANTSLHALLATENSAGTAGAMRIFEIAVEKVDREMKPLADAFLKEIHENFGHLGEEFMAYVVTHKEEVFERVRKKITYLDRRLKAEGAERFWTSTAAAALIAGEIAFDLGLIAYDIAAIEQWLIEEQFPQLRGTVRDEHAVYDPANMLMAYINQMQDQIIKVVRTDRLADGSFYSDVLHEPHGALVGHFDFENRQLWIRRDHFRDWCVKHAKQMNSLLAVLAHKRILGDRNTKRTLGLGTRFAQGRTQCFVINMAHPEVSELGEHIAKQAGGKVIQFKRKTPEADPVDTPEAPATEQES